ncbi:MAG: OmpH family outer membrane protein [Prevotella sp.]|nr:OmpH family outer membrane protein [Prevotella sp.]
MKKLFLLLALVALPFVADAQTAKYATFSYDSVMHVMPDYKAALATLADLRKQYDAEIKRTEDDFNAKYESFIEVYSGLDINIRNKRQNELQELMARGMAFKEETRRLLRNAEKDLLKPVRARIDAALTEVAQENGYDFVLNTDNNAIPYTNPEISEDITMLLKEKLVRDK